METTNKQDADLKSAIETLDKMLAKRIELQRRLLKENLDTRFNEGWIDALEHVVGLLHLRRAPEPAREGLLEEALRKAAEQFRFYEREHRKKANDSLDHYAKLDRIEKAQSNKLFADMCEAALKSTPPLKQYP